MHFTEKLKTGRKTYSFEFYPPKKEEDAQALFETLRELKPLAPDFVSVTNSSSGSAPYRTVALSAVIKEKFGLEVMAHLTCVAHTREEIRQIADRLAGNGINNVLALRGDVHNLGGQAPKRDYRFAADLVEDLKKIGGFEIGVAAYPEKHPGAKSLEADIRHLRTKLCAGGSFAVTQLFFDNAAYFSFVDKCRAAGIDAPIMPGLMPVTGYKQLKSFSELFAVSVPREVSEGIEKYAHDRESLLAFSVDYASRQARELLEKGAPGLHFYTLNRSRAVLKIFANIR